MKLLMDADCLIKLTKAGLKELVCRQDTVVIPNIVKYEVVDAGKAKDCDDAYVVEKIFPNIPSPLLIMSQTTQRAIVLLLIFFSKGIMMQLQPMMRN
jgi:hypothetical protein